MPKHPISHRPSRVATVVSAIAMLLVAASPAMAQDGGTSFFQMFLWTPDLLGNIIIWGLVATSMASIGFAIYLFTRYRQTEMSPEDTQQQVESMLAEKRYREAIDFANSDDSYLGTLLAAALNEAANGYGAMQRAIEEAGDAETARILRPVEYLNVIGNISPMIGLFGTVYGMIRAFQGLVEAGGRPDPSVLAGGISTALVTTLWGLVVAIPALACYSVIRNKIDAITGDVILLAEDLLRPFKPGGKRTSASGGGDGDGSASRPRATPQPGDGS